MQRGGQDRDPQLAKLFEFLAALSSPSRSIEDILKFNKFLSENADKARQRPSAEAFLILVLNGKKMSNEITKKYKQQLREAILAYQETNNCTIDLLAILHFYKKIYKNSSDAIDLFLFAPPAEKISETKEEKSWEPLLKTFHVMKLTRIGKLATKEAEEKTKEVKEMEEKFQYILPNLDRSQDTSVKIDETEAISKAKAAALLLGVKGKFEVKDSKGKLCYISGERGTSTHAIKTIGVILKNFLEQKPKWSAEQIERLNTFIQSIENPYIINDFFHIKKALYKGNGILLPCFLFGHQVYSYVYVDKKANNITLIHCNRGDGFIEKPNKEGSNLIYTSSPPFDNAIKAVQSLLNYTNAVNARSFYNTFTMKIKDGFKYKGQGLLPLKLQKSENCTVANLKGLLSDILEQKNYKEVTTHMRITMIDYLIKQVAERFEKKENPEDIARSAELNILIQYLKQKTPAALQKNNQRKIKLIWHVVDKLNDLANTKPTDAARTYILKSIAPYVEAKEIFSPSTTTAPQNQKELVVSHLSHFKKPKISKKRRPPSKKHFDPKPGFSS